MYRRRFANGVEQVFDDGPGVHPFAQRIVIGDDAVPQHRYGHVPDIGGFRAGRPSSKALALAAVTKCWVARGPAPQAT